MQLPDFCENYRVFRSSWRKLLRLNITGKRHIFNLPIIFPLMDTLAPFSKHIQSFLSQFGIKIISLNAFNFRIIFSFDWHKEHHSWRENIHMYLNKGLIIPSLKLPTSGWRLVTVNTGEICCITNALWAVLRLCIRSTNFSSRYHSLLLLIREWRLGWSYCTHGPFNALPWAQFVLAQNVALGKWRKFHSGLTGPFYKIK